MRSFVSYKQRSLFSLRTPLFIFEMKHRTPPHARKRCAPLKPMKEIKSTFCYALYPSKIVISLSHVVRLATHTYTRTHSHTLTHMLCAPSFYAEKERCSYPHLQTNRGTKAHPGVLPTTCSCPDSPRIALNSTLTVCTPTSAHTTHTPTHRHSDTQTRSCVDRF